MCSSRVNRLPKSIVIMLFGFFVLATLALPQSASALHRWRAGLEIEVGDYDYLSDYGEWVRLPSFGVVWHPFVVEDWAPFHHGHWVYTYDGWAWASYEPFGWLVYHYGYWYHDWRIGWFWVPGRIWSPAQVEWYTFGDYCGWAPLPPPNYYWNDPWVPHHGLNIWFFVNINHFTDDEIWRHRAPDPPHRGISRHEVYARRAPSIRNVEAVTRRQIAPVRISRERVERRTEDTRTPTKYNRPKEIERQRMVLPDSEVERVRQHAPRVEREVLVPKEKAQTHEQLQRPVERKTEERQKESQQKKTIKRR
jgi:hypothetical protein